jgi:hypothetical protein
MSGPEADPHEQIDSRPDRAEWLGGEAMVSFHRREARIPLGLGSFRCTGLSVLLIFAGGLLIGHLVTRSRRLRHGTLRRRW